MTLNDRAKQRLESIRKKNGGTLQPATVLDDAINPKSPLHEFFTWDDTEAAARYRLIEAGKLIVRVRLEIEPRNDHEVRMSVQMYEATGQESGERTYRHIADIANNEEYYAEVLATAKKELQSFQHRYQMLKELRGLFEQINEVLAAE